MNIFEQEDIIKGLPDQALMKEAQMPSGRLPQYLVVSEIQRRADMRKRFAGQQQQAPAGTIKDQVISGGIAEVQPMPKAMQMGMQGMQQGMAPRPPMAAPPAMPQQAQLPPPPPQAMAPQGPMPGAVRMFNGEDVPNNLDDQIAALQRMGVSMEDIQAYLADPSSIPGVGDPSLRIGESQAPTLVDTSYGTGAFLAGEIQNRMDAQSIPANMPMEDRGIPANMPMEDRGGPFDLNLIADQSQQNQNREQLINMAGPKQENMELIPGQVSDASSQAQASQIIVPPPGPDGEDNRPSYARLDDPEQDAELRKILESGRTAVVNGVEIRLARPADNIPGTFGMTNESIMAEQKEMAERRAEIEREEARRNIPISSELMINEILDSSDSSLTEEEMRMEAPEDTIIKEQNLNRERLIEMASERQEKFPNAIETDASKVNLKSATTPSEELITYGLGVSDNVTKGLGEIADEFKVAPDVDIPGLSKEAKDLLKDPYESLRGPLDDLEQIKTDYLESGRQAQEKRESLAELIRTQQIPELSYSELIAQSDQRMKERSGKLREEGINQALIAFGAKIAEGKIGEGLSDAGKAVAASNAQRRALEVQQEATRMGLNKAEIQAKFNAELRKQENNIKAMEVEVAGLEKLGIDEFNANKFIADKEIIVEKAIATLISSAELQQAKALQQADKEEGLMRRAVLDTVEELIENDLFNNLTKDEKYKLFQKYLADVAQQFGVEVGKSEIAPSATPNPSSANNGGSQFEVIEKKQSTP